MEALFSTKFQMRKMYNPQKPTKTNDRSTKPPKINVKINAYCRKRTSLDTRDIVLKNIGATPMDNKQAYKLASEIISNLVKSKAVKGSDAVKDNIFRTIKASKATEKKQDIDKKKEEEFELAHKLATDRTFARGWLIQQLAGLTSGNNATAAKELRDLLRIDSAEEAAVIVQRFQDVPINCVHCGENVHKPLELT